MEQDKTMTSTASTQQTQQQQQPHKVIVTDDSVEEEKKVADKENKPGIKANVKEEIKQFAPDIKANVKEEIKQFAPEEISAAAIAHGLDKKKGKRNILVFNLGGGTLDVSLLTFDNGVSKVLARNGDTRLGDEDFDQRTMEYFIKLIKNKTRKDLRKDNRAVQKLRREVEKATRALSVQHRVKMKVESIIYGSDFSETLTRAKFENLNMDLFRGTLKAVQKVLEDADMKKDDIHEIVSVGGSTRIPKIQQLLKDFIGKEPSRGINSDEAVAYGAADQAGVISGEEDTEIVLDPLTLGIETVGGVMTKLINRNTVPIKKAQVFSTAADNQPTITIQVYEGERPMTKDNHMLGKFDLTGIPPAPRGVPQIEVTFEIDVNGILHVTAEDKGTGNKNKITITNDHNRLSPEDIKRMITDAEKSLLRKFAKEDNKSRLIAKIVATILDKIKILYDNNRLSPEDIERMVNNVEKLADCGEDNESRLILKTIATMLGKLLRRTSPTTDDPVIELDDQPGPSYK
uniref:Uncharacterized protein n=1 Tax=Meloidogyne enterolobii TaxID=390850 RepID=A0A6V7UBQ3_MELEN|nr:unnamed protein product [Meloidogyne enterolobii]